jgi:hypothetical protein
MTTASVYTNSDTCRWHLNCIGKTDTTHAIFHIPFPLTIEFKQAINNALIQHDRIIILGSELHSSTVEFIIQNQNPKITYFLCGIIDGITTQRWMDWFITSTEFYKQSNILNHLIPYLPKPKTFDILLGQPRLHRDYVYNFINCNKLNEQVVMTYLQNKTIQQQDSTGWIWESEPTSNEFKWTVTPVNYHGSTLSLSQIIPISIYNQTAYSIVAETNFDNHYSFYTEKIVKPILAERLFLVFSGQHYLRNLRSMGFKTFDTIVDERYDEEADPTIRFGLVCDEMNRLINLPQQQVLDSIRPITEHNRNVMLETDWLGQFHSELKTALTETK